MALIIDAKFLAATPTMVAQRVAFVASFLKNKSGVAMNPSTTLSMNEINAALDRLANVSDRHLKKAYSLGWNEWQDNPLEHKSSAAMEKAKEQALPAINQLKKKISLDDLEFVGKIYYTENYNYGEWCYSKSDTVLVEHKRSPKRRALKATSWLVGLGFGTWIVNAAINDWMQALWFIPLYFLCLRISHAADVQANIYFAREQVRTRGLHHNLSRLQRALGLRSPAQISPVVLYELAEEYRNRHQEIVAHYEAIQAREEEKREKARVTRALQAKAEEQALRDEWESEPEERRQNQSFTQWREVREERRREEENRAYEHTSHQPMFNVGGSMMMAGTNLDVHGNPFGYDPGPTD